MKKSLHMIAVLAVVGFISGASLVFIYSFANPQIELNKKKALEQAIFKILPDAKSYDSIEVDGEEIYKGYDASGNLVGYAFQAVGPGYQDNIVLMTGITPDLERLSGIEVLESKETPGLGGEITSKKFKDQFDNLAVLPKIEYVKSRIPDKSNEIQAITGATISTDAVCEILNKKIARVRELLRR